jgi:ABC-2 type transport system permease protein
MKMRNAILIMKKDLQEIRSTRYVMFTILLMPLVFSALIPLTSLGAATGNVTAKDLQQLGIQPVPGQTPNQQLFHFLIGNMIFLFFIIPLITPSMIGSYSVVGEKLGRSLEPLLATPIEETELLAGKMMAGVIPAVVSTLASFAIFTGIINVMALFVLGLGPSFLFIPGAEWFFAVLVISPLMAFLSMAITVILSSRMNDIRAVEQAGAMVVLPVAGLFALSFVGRGLSGVSFLAVIALVVLAVDLALFKTAKRLFRREEILTKWR